MGEQEETEHVRQNLAAEARKFDAEAEAAHADAKVKLAQARLNAALAVETEASAQEAMISLARERRKEKVELAGNDYHHLYAYGSQVSASSARACIAKLTEWMRNDLKCDIEIVFNSPGGEVVEGMALFDFVQTVRASGHHVTCSTIGYAASMAGILLQAGDHRVMGRQSWLLLHEGSFGAVGNMGEVIDTVDWVKRIQARIADIFADRCQAADPQTATKRLTKRQIITRWTRKNWWVDAEEALAFGLCDEIR
jgi:ATP-dependent Clp protease protease subunit